MLTRLVSLAADSAVLLSSCLVMLVRLTLESDRTDQAADAIWQGSLFALRRLVSTLATFKRVHDWDVAELALSRAHYFVPLLASKAPEFGVVLEP